MSSQYTYEERLFHCPAGCGWRATHRAVEAYPYRPCPRCQGATLADFKDDRVPQIEPAPLIVEHPTND